MFEADRPNGIGRLAIASEAARRIERAAIAALPEEACGLLLGQWRAGDVIDVDRAVATPNAAPPADRGRRFVIEPRVLLEWDRAASTAGRSIVGFFHSHPDAPARPSATDAALAWPGYVYLIVATRGAAVGAMAAWTFDDAARSFREVPIQCRATSD